MIIGIGGAYSGVGKTHIAVSLLERLKGWGAIKYTKTSLYSSITDDQSVLSEKGKDTCRFLDAGAEKVLWVQSPPSQLDTVLPKAVDMLAALQGIIIEGNSALNAPRPDIIVFVSGSRPELTKPSAYAILRKAHVVIYDREMPSGLQNDTKAFEKNQVREFVDFIAHLLKMHGEQAIS